MATTISDLQPKILWENFAKICSVPHPSGKEQKLVKLIKEFGEKLGLETIVDEVGNIIIRKPATPGMENRKCVTIQGHIDMVPQQNKIIIHEFERDIHDFEKDPIRPIIDEDWVTAKDTTLGADNGIGVAAAMAVLQSKDIKHGPIETLFTVEEETSMAGVFALKPDILKGNILLNLDSESDDTLWIGCAGGLYLDAIFKYTEDKVPSDYIPLKVNVDGLKGGHSGGDIHLGRGNANKLLTRFLWEGKDKYKIKLANIFGGEVYNAIPRESFAVIAIPQNQEEEFLKFVDKFELTIRNEIGTVDPTFHITAEPTDMPKSIIDEKAQNDFLNALHGCPDGVIGMCKEIHDLVETSTNLGKVFLENGKIEVGTLQRSSVDSLLDNTGNAVVSIFTLAGAETKIFGRYPGWKPNIKSPILKLMKTIYKNKVGKDAFIKAIHAGLECGLIGSKYPKMDMISFGPNITHAHSPDERAEIKSVALFWDLLVETLKNIPAK